MATTPPNLPAGATLEFTPPSRIVGIADYSTVFAVATEKGVWRYSAADGGRMIPVPFVVMPGVAT